jgi:uncharacterized protein YbjT (DUF2867 family)
MIISTDSAAPAVAAGTDQIKIRRLLLLGATGRTGRYVMKYALAKGIEVVALARNPEKIAAGSELLTIVPGTALRQDDVSAAIAGCDAVVSTLNSNRESDMPWARQVSPPGFMTESLGHCITAMRANDVRRIVVLSAIGVGDSFAHAPVLLRFLIRHTNLRITYEDHKMQEALLQESGLDWTSVRAVALTNSERPKELVVSFDNQPKAALTIGRQHVARFIVDCLQSSEYLGKSPVISER